MFTAEYAGIVEFCYVLEVSASIKISDGQLFDVSAGNAFVLDAGLKTINQ